MKIALAQINCKFGDVQSNLATVASCVAEAKSRGADAIVFPEMIDTGYEMQTISRLAADKDGEPRRQLSAMARNNSMWIIAGLSLREGAKVFNTAVAFDRAGELHTTYRKIHLFTGEPAPENKTFTAGDAMCIFEMEGLHVSLMICYDLRFPELARASMLCGAEVMIFPAAWPPIRIAHWSALLKARAIENYSYVIGVNRVGKDGESEFGGRSTAIDPSGLLLCEQDENSARLDVVDLLPERIREVRNSAPALRDRRPELYRI